MKRLSFLVFLFFIPAVLAPMLPPAESPDFVVSPIFLTDFGLAGNKSFLNVYWKAYLYSGEIRNINVTCILNGIQRCEKLVPPGEGACSFPNPSYTSLTGDNNISCYFSDPLLGVSVEPLIKYFKPVDFTINLRKVQLVAGDKASMEIDITNYGLFVDRYVVNVFTSDTDVLWVDPRFENLVTQEVKGESYFSSPETLPVHVNLLLLDASKKATLCVRVASSLEPTAVKPAPGEQCFIIEGKPKNLSGIELFHILQLLILSMLIIATKLK